MVLDQSVNYIATVLFALAVIHTFMSGFFKKIASNYKPGSMGENFFHFLGEVEVVFGLWAGIFILSVIVISGRETAFNYTDNLDFKEPLFVFAVMVISATRPVRDFAQTIIVNFGKIIPLPKGMGFYCACLIIGPLLGSIITEPAAMTVTALILRDNFFKNRSAKFMYLTLAVLFVNISVGGVLTHFAAPPVLMVANKWGWDTPFMFTHFGWRAMLGVIINAVGASFYLRRELGIATNSNSVDENIIKVVTPPLLVGIHLVFLALVVATSHHPVIFMGLFLFFLGVCAITAEYQDELKLKESLLVGFFLGGLVVLGAPQRWWLEPLIAGLNQTTLYLGAAALTAVTDNAALTFLGSQIPDISDSFKYALVAGAVAGGGLTVIANAPNPAGYSILQGSFGDNGIKPLNLFLAALPPTLVVLVIFWV
ncbi:MAG: putative Na+/H+ antiporter [Bdellovibrionota bacterium]